MISKKYFIMLALVLLIPILFIPVYGGDGARTGTAAATQLLVPIGPRSIAMGGSNIATVTGLEAIYWNPAGLSKMNHNFGAMVSSMNILYDMRTNYLGIGAKVGRIGSVGFFLKSISVGDIPLTTRFDYESDSGVTYSPTLMTMGLVYSKRLTTNIAVGLNTKLIYESIPRASASALAFDIGIQYNNLGGINGLDFGVFISNFGSNMRFSGSGLLQEGSENEGGTNAFLYRPVAKNDLPANIQLGVTYQAMKSEEQSVQLSTVFLSNNYGEDHYKLGMEYGYQSKYFVRAGYDYLANVDSNDRLYGFAVGAGFQLKTGNSTMVFDYAYRPSNVFDNENVFSLKVLF